MKKTRADRTWSLLVASSAMDDPFFEKSVVLLLEDGEEGSFGVLINRRFKFPPSPVISELSKFKKLSALHIFMGGPVDKDKLTIAVWGNLNSAIGNFSFGLNPNKAEKLLEANAAAKGAIFSGYCAWESGQLEAEIAEGMWLSCDVDLSLLETDKPEGIWEKLTMLANPLFSKFPIPNKGDSSKN